MRNKILFGVAIIGTAIMIAGNINPDIPVVVTRIGSGIAFASLFSINLSNALDA